MIKRTLGLLFLTATLLCGTLFFVYREEIGRRLTRHLIAQLEEETGYTFAFTGVQFHFPLDLKAQCVTISAEKQPLAKLHDLHVVLNFSELLNKTLVIENLEASLIVLQGSTEKESSSFGIPSLPIQIRHFSIGQLKIDPTQLSEQIKTFIENGSIAKLQGSASCDPLMKQISIALTLGEKPLETQAQINLNEEGHENLHLKCEVLNALPNVLQKKWNLPEGYHGKMVLEAMGTPEGWQRGDLMGCWNLSYRHDDPALMHPRLGPSGYCSGNFTLSNAQKIELTALSLQLGPLTASGSCIMTQQTIEKATFAATLHTPVKELKDLDIHFPEIHLKGIISGSFENLDSIIMLETPSTDYKIFNHQPCRLIARCLWDGSLLHIPEFKASIGENPCEGNLHIHLSPLQISGNLEGSFDFATLPLDCELKGIASYHSHFSPAGTSITLTSDQMQFEKFAAKQLKINWTATSDLQTGLLSLHCQHVQSPYGDLEEFNGETTLRAEAIDCPFSFACRKTGSEPFELLCRGSWDYINSSEWNISVDSAKGTFFENPFSLLAPVHFTFSQEQSVLSPLSVTVGPGSLHLEGASSIGHAHAFLFFKEMPLSILKHLVPALPNAGIFSGEAIIAESAEGTTEAHLELQVKEIDHRLSSMAIPMQMELKADLKDNSLQCQGHFLINDREPLPFTATLPLSLSLRTPRIEINPKLPISSTISLNHPIEPFLEMLLPTSKLSLQGTLIGDILLSGTLESPQVSGSANLVSGTFELFDLSTVVRQLNAHFELQGQQLVVTHLQGISSHSNSKVTGSGHALLDWEQSLPFELALQVKEIGMHFTSFATARASGELKVSGSLQSGLLQGKLISDEILVKLPSEMPDSAETIDVIYMTPQDPASIDQSKTRAFWPLSFDIDLQVPKNATISGEGWTSKWRATAQLTGTAEAPLLNGSCHLVDGNYRLSDKIFQIKEGTITFAGDFHKKTSLYVIASKDLDAIKAEIILKGPIKNPSISFRSNPSLSQREILSWILFNQGSSEITSFQGTQLNESISNLNMGNGKPDMLTALRNRIGIDRIGIQREQGVDSEGLSVQVGKYIAPNVLVAVNKSITAETNSLAVEATLQKNIKVQAEIGDDAEGQLLFKWKHDY